MAVRVEQVLAETWKDIPGFEGEYQVSDRGKVRSLDRIIYRPHPTQGSVGVTARGRLLRPVATVRGDLKVSLTQGKQFAVHTLVALAFIGPRPAGQEVCHFDGDSHNNHLDNLRYDTHAGNEADKERHGTFNRGERNGQAKLSDDAVSEIRDTFRTVGRRELATKFGVRPSHIDRVLRRERWGHIA